MTCEQHFDRYLSLDKNERVPLSLTLHLLVCPVCRTGVRHLTRAEIILAASLSPQKPLRNEDPVVAASLAMIAAAGLAYPAVEDEDEQVSLSRWLVSGIALAASFAIIPFSSIGAWSQTVFGNSFSVPFYISCGVIITAYFGLFVGTNIDLFVKKFGFQRTV